VSLRSALTANLPVKITSVALSVFLWFLAAGGEPATTLLPVDVAVRAPAGRSVLRTPGPLTALVVGPRRELLKLSATPLRLTRILPDSTIADEVRLDLDPGDLEVPPGVGVHVQNIEPRTLTVTLDSTFQREVPVLPVVRLGQDTSHALGAISVVPGTVRLLGSRDQLQRVDSVRTMPLEIARAEGPVENVVRIDTSSFGTIRAIPGEVTVRVDVEALGMRTIAGVPIRLSSITADDLRPEVGAVRVRLSGAAGRLAALTAESLFIVLDRTGAAKPGRVRLRVIAPPGIAGRAEPDSVTLVHRSGRG
jgi:hypothetical protein